MTMFLASVADVREAESALVHGADIIDLKNASESPLGALRTETVREIVAAVAERRPLSAVAGNLPMEPDVMLAAATAMADTGVEYVKVGLLPCPKRDDCIRALLVLARRIKLVGVMFADHGADHALVPLMAESGFAGAMLDTARKDGRGLLEHIPINALLNFVNLCRGYGMLTGLAGSLELPDIPRLLMLSPDYLGFRGALCARQDRAGQLDPQLLDIVRGMIPLDPRSVLFETSNGPKIDYRLLAARGYSIDPSKDESSIDRIFVQDFVLPVHIGAYAREREKPQSLRFNVEVKVLRSDHAAADMRDIFSYDVVTDGIRIIVGQGHIALLETLAERVAELVLAQTRVVCVKVRVEKLDIGPGGVGVEIVRERTAEVAKVQQLFSSLSAQTNPKAAE